MAPTLEKSDKIKEQTLFFCGGPPKSGTTFLQRLLDLHPDVSCPSEDNLDFLAHKILSIHDVYNKNLSIVASRIGVENCPLVDIDVYYQVYGNLVREIAKNRSLGEPIVGISDNEFLLNNLAPCLQNLFRGSKAILIFRNPIDTAISSWKHNHRLYKKEGNAKHLEIMKIDGKLNLDDYVLSGSKQWNIKTKERLQTAKKLPESVFVVTYEALLQNKKETLIKLLDFLGCEYNEAIISDMIKNSAFDVMKSNSSSPEFFSSGKIRFGQDELDANTIKAAIKLSADGMKLLNIPLPKNTI